ncbi:MAG TPA: ABC transporter permease [Phycisphaerales bacterium]|nr:ABC transporter permease [Phycisphaerales bacterium]HMP35961.1 ABC transporter permease [Phycisphaerales bacterium]
MTTYIVRRLLVMLPTLLGISLLVFLLVALSPGGVAAALTAGAGGQREGGAAAAALEAYYEERYGLDDPVPIQYLRWLGRVSPIRFGTRDQVTASGDLVRVPRVPRPPLLSERWSAPAAEEAAGEGRGARGAAPVVGVGGSADGSAPPRDADADRAELRIRFRGAERRLAEARAALLGARTELRRALHAYAVSVELPQAIDGGTIREAAFAAHQPRLDRAEWIEAERAGAAARAAHARALAAREDLRLIFAERPWPEAGLPIVPGLLWIAAPDFGVSFIRNRPVIDLVMAALPVTLLLNLLAFPIIYLVAIPSGMLAASRRGSWIDVSLGALFVALWSIPTVWAGVMAVGFLASSHGLGWFPVGGLHANDAAQFAFLPRTGPAGFDRGWLLDALWHVCLPVACLAYGGFAILAKQTRAAMLENIGADYVRTARAKGVPGRAVLLRHVFRNSLIPLITIFVGLFPALLSGSVVVERIFSIPGMGSLAIEAIALRDRELILANTMMIAVVSLAAMLLADILYVVADPRVSYEG